MIAGWSRRPRGVFSSRRKASRYAASRERVRPVSQKREDCLDEIRRAGLGVEVQVYRLLERRARHRQDLQRLGAERGTPAAQLQTNGRGVVPLDDIERAPGLRGERPEHRWFREE